MCSDSLLIILIAGNQQEKGCVSLVSLHPNARKSILPHTWLLLQECAALRDALICVHPPVSKGGSNVRSIDLASAVQSNLQVSQLLLLVQIVQYLMFRF